MLDDKWSQRFAHLETMILTKSFAVPVELVQKPSSEVMTIEKPFFDPPAHINENTGLVTQPLQVVTIGVNPVQATRDVAASLTVTQPVEAPGAKVATQPVEIGKPVPHQ